MSIPRPKSLLVPLVVLSALLVLLSFGATIASASPPEEQCFDMVAGLGGLPGPWSSTGLIASEGTAYFAPFVAGADPKLGIPATLHDRHVLTDDYGSITIQGQGKSALVQNDDGAYVPGYNITWAIISGTGAYANLRGQGGGIAWPDFANGLFIVRECGKVHFDLQS